MENINTENNIEKLYEARDILLEIKNCKKKLACFENAVNYCCSNAIYQNADKAYSHIIKSMLRVKNYKKWIINAKKILIDIGKKDIIYLYKYIGNPTIFNKMIAKIEDGTLFFNKKYLRAFRIANILGEKINYIEQKKGIEK